MAEILRITSQGQGSRLQNLFGKDNKMLKVIMAILLFTSVAYADELNAVNTDFLRQNVKVSPFDIKEYHPVIIRKGDILELYTQNAETVEVDNAKTLNRMLGTGLIIVGVMSASSFPQSYTLAPAITGMLSAFIGYKICYKYRW